MLIYIILSIILLFTIPSAYAYIDPGTGGYLLSTVWAWIVGAVTFIAVGIAHFFKHQLRKWWNKRSLTLKMVIIAIPIIAIISVAGFLIYKDNSGYKLPDYDPNLVNVTLNTDQAYEGYTLVEGKLIDLDGNVVHEWSNWYLGTIDENGDLYAQNGYEGSIFGRYSWEGDIIWEKELPIHHEILLTPQDTIIVLTKEVYDYNERKVEFDVILELDKEGNILKKWSTWDNLEQLHQYHANLELDKPPSVLLKDNAWKNTSIWGGNYDYYHMNAVSLVPENSMQGKHPAFKPGNYLISFRHGSMVFIVDKDTGKVVWRAIYDQVEDNLEGPHAPQMLQNGNILIYDNGRYREWTRLVIIDPVTLEVVGQYQDEDFFSYSQGFVQILPNNNLLITESEEGHVFELGPGMEIVWEWWHPEMFDDKEKLNYGKRHDIYRAVRYDKEFIDKLLE